MKHEFKDPPRGFRVGKEENNITIYDCGDVNLDPNEQVTFKTDSGTEYDLARKDWGYYATPSLNSRLTRFNLRAVLIKNVNSGHYFVLLVEQGKEDAFNDYLQKEDLKIITWLDNDTDLGALEDKVGELQNG